MYSNSETTSHHFPILTLVGGDLERCDTMLKMIAYPLAEKSIDILVVYTHKKNVPGKCRINTFIDYPYDTFFLDEAHSAGDKIDEDSARTRMILSRHSLSYDLIIFCNTDNSGSEEVQLFEGSSIKGKPLFQLQAGDDLEPILSGLYEWLLQHVLAMPVWGCLLIGGKSSRMGRPKHLILDANGVTWGEKTVRTLTQATDRVVLSGSGEIPPSLTHLERLADIPDAQGPLAGILAVMRWNPHVSFIVAACDMPGIQEDSLRWLLGRRRPGIWGAVPLHPQSKRREPLFAYYDYRSRVLFEELLERGSLRPNHICRADKIETPVVPAGIAESWCNCNTPEDLSKHNY